MGSTEKLFPVIILKGEVESIGLARMKCCNICDIRMTYEVRLKKIVLKRFLDYSDWGMRTFATTRPSASRFLWLFL